MNSEWLKPFNMEESANNINHKLKNKKLLEIVSGTVEFYDTDRPIPNLNMSFNRFIINDDELDGLKYRIQAAFVPLFNSDVRLKVTLKTNSVFGI